MGNYLHDALLKALGNHPNVGEIRRMGLINAIELVTNKEAKEGFEGSLRMGYQIYKKALDRGLLLRPLGNVIYFNPPLTIDKETIDIAIERTVQAMADVLG